MVRTRRTNKQKRYTEFALGDDEQDGSSHRGSAVADDDGDESDFAAGPGDDDEVSANDDLEYDEAAGDLSDAAVISKSTGGGGGGGGARGASTARGKSQRGAPATAAVAAAAGRHVDHHELPGYPLDPRVSTRAYTGPLKRGVRAAVLRDVMYGPEYSRAKLVWDMYERWARHAVLPARLPPAEARGGVLPSPWVPAGFEMDRAADAARWFAGAVVAGNGLRSRTLLKKHGERLVPRSRGELAVLLGPVQEQREVKLRAGGGMAVAATGLPVGEGLADSAVDEPNGWLFDVGGIVLSLGWAPVLTGYRQILALAVIPHSDQARPTADVPAVDEEEKKQGSVQFWEFLWERDAQQRLRPCRSPPRFLSAMCFDWGRPKRMQWCPVSLASAGRYGLLAVLTGDGRVRVLDVKPPQSSETAGYEWIDAPVATLGISDNYNVEATCFTWVGCNRIALGHTDGSVSLWSIFPTQLLQRHAVHASHVLDISSGYPSLPHMVASVPVGGFTTLVDLSSPTAEYTYVNAPGIQFQPGTLDWSDHLQGWFVLAPAGGPGLNTVVFLSVRYFPLAKSMFTSMSMPMCVSAGGNHPYPLVGCADGSVWSFNSLSKLFRQRGEDTFKIKIFEHEFRPLEMSQVSNDEEVDREGRGARLRGASRFLQGFLPEVNDDPRSERLREINKKRLESKNKKKKPAKGKKGKARQNNNDALEGEADLDGDGTGEDISAHMASRMIMHEPLTRVSAVAWNPNVEYATWAAVALGSGLVRVMDIGVD